MTVRSLIFSTSTFLNPLFINISNNFYYFCSSLEDGGAIFINNIGIQFFLYLSVFFSCSTSKTGGAIAVFFSNSTKISQICFYNCSSLSFCPTFNIWGNSKLVYLCQLNFSSDSSPIKNIEGSHIASKETLLSNNNASNCETTIYGIHFCVSSSEKQLICSFNQLSNSKGPSFLLVHNSNLPLFIYFNFINITLTNSGFFEIHINEVNPIISNCNFLNITKTYLYRYSGGASKGIPKFNNCKFDFFYDLIYFSIVNLTNNQFLPNLFSPLILNLLNSNICWINSSNLITYQKLKFFNNAIYKILLTKILINF